MNIHGFAKLLRTRWVIICLATFAAVLGAIAYTVLTTPLYKASTRLFVSTSAGQSASDLYNSNRYSQERVLSYAELITGQTLAQRTVDRLSLDMPATKLQAKVTAKTKLNTVLIDVAVLDQSPVRARDIANALSEEFVSMVRELETPKPGGQPDARVIVEQRATVPEKPVVPKPVRNIALGLALGMLLGIGVAVVWDLLDNTVKDRETIEEITGVGLVGVIPSDKELRVKHAITFDGNNSILAESFRKFRTNLQFLAVDNPPRVIVVTSPAPSEGKSTMSINMALVLAEAGNEVVIVDGDMRRPSLAKYFDLVGTVGFSTVLSGNATIAEVLQKTKYPHLTLLPAGPHPPNPSELAGSKAAKTVISELRGQFDYVIIDTSPLCAVTDAAILAANSDGVVILTKFAQTKREALAQAIGNLHDVGATLLGAVMTQTPPRGNGEYGYTYTYYGDDSSSRSSRRKHPAKSAGPHINITKSATDSAQ